MCFIQNNKITSKMLSAVLKYTAFVLRHIYMIHISVLKSTKNYTHKGVEGFTKTNLKNFKLKCDKVITSKT